MPDGQRWTIGRVTIALIIVSIIVFWAWALGPFGPRGNPDSLEDTTYGPTAEVHCRAALAEINALPLASTATSPADRADVLVEANAILDRLVDSLEASVEPNPSSHDKVILDKWLSDWNIYVADRYDHVDRLRTEGDVPFQVSRVESNSVTGRIDAFARVNNMDTCTVPLDL